MADENQNYDDYSAYDDGPQDQGAWAKASAFFGRIRERFNRKILLVSLACLAALAVLVFLAVFFWQKFAAPKAQTENLPQASAIKIEDTLVLPRTDATAVGIVRLKNTSAVYGLANMQYSWRAFDAAGAELKSGQGASYILPSQEKYILIALTGIRPQSLKFEILSKPRDFTRLAAAKDIVLDRVNAQYNTQEDGFHVRGGILNKSPYIIRSLDLTAIIKNSSGRLVGAVSTRLSDVAPGVISQYDLLWPQSLPPDSIVDLRTSFNLFDDFNFPLASAR